MKPSVAEPIPPICPRCAISPLRFIASGDCSDSTGGGVYVCACGYSTARDLLVADLLRELRAVSRLLEEFADLALPRLVRCALGTCDGAHDPALDTLRDLAELLGADPAAPDRPGATVADRGDA